MQNDRVSPFNSTPIIFKDFSNSTRGLLKRIYFFETICEKETYNLLQAESGGTYGATRID
jgi:hypothetical protein